MRLLWNGAALRKWCAASRQQLFIIPAEDRIKGRSLNMKERYAVAGLETTQKRRKRKDLPEEVEVARGMKVMVTSNIQTDLDLANGARGEIIDIVLHASEPPVAGDSTMRLEYLPAYILVKMSRTRATCLPGLEEGVIPLEPSTSTMQIQVDRGSDGKAVTRTVKRRQFPITAAYAFTDYRSQGQAIPTVIVDIKQPLGPAHLSLFNLYVALSRSSGRETIRLLRDFDDSMFMQSHDADLLAEDDRLDMLDHTTTTWWQTMTARQDGSSIYSGRSESFSVRVHYMGMLIQYITQPTQRRTVEHRE